MPKRALCIKLSSQLNKGPGNTICTTSSCSEIDFQGQCWRNLWEKCWVFYFPLFCFFKSKSLAMSPRLALNLKSNCLHFSAALGLVLLWQMHTTKPSEEIFLIQSIKSQKGQEESEDHWSSDLKMRSGVMVDLGKGVQSEPALITIDSCLPPGILNIRTFSVHSHRWNHLDANFMKKDTQKHYEQADPEVTEQGDRTLWPESPCPECLPQHFL